MNAVYSVLLRIGKVAGALSFIFGIFYGAHEYFENQKAKQVEQTLGLYRQYNSAPYSNYRESITKALLRNKAQIVESAVDVKKLQAVIVAMVDKEEIGKDLLLIMDFFDGVTVCVIRKICDTETTQQLFSRRALELLRNFYQYIEVQRSSSAADDFGAGLEAVAKMRVYKSADAGR